MAIDVKLSAEPRTKFGTSESRRLRRKGLVPGNIYGHGVDAAAFSVSADDLRPIIVGGTRILELDFAGKTELAMFGEVQWDTFGTYVQHIDLIRVDRDQRVEVEVPIVLRGIASGTISGGVVDLHLRHVTLECAAYAIPEKISVRISHMEIGDVIHVSDLELPDETNVKTEMEEVVVQINEPKEEIEETTEDLGPIEPEVIGRKAEDEEEESK